MKKRNKLPALFFAAALALALTVSGPVQVSADGQAGTTLSATVTAAGYWTITYPWTIDKSVSPDTWHLFRGDSGTSEYTITVTKGPGVEEAWVAGEICVHNGGEVATEDLAILAELKNGYEPPNDLLVSAPVSVSTNPVLDPGETGCYDYAIPIPITGEPFPQPNPGHTYKVTANVTITNHSGSLGTPVGPSPSTTTVFPSSPTETNGTIHVDDTNGGSWSFSEDGSVSYDRTFTCDGDAGQHDNTATIQETGQYDDASVMVHCYALDVTKTAEPSLVRTYNWTIDKSADESELILSTGQQYLLGYEVTVDLDDPPYTDSDWAVSGEIYVHNPAPIPATINNVTDIISPDIVPIVNCGVTFPYMLPAGATLTCTYSADLPNASTRTNTATATLQNYDYGHDLSPTPTGTTDFTGTTTVDFADPGMTLVDTCVDVSDSYAGFLGTVCYDDPPPVTFTYSRWIGPYEACGSYTVENTAPFITNDTGSTGSDSWTVIVTVPCDGCTLTQGYWKTHSDYGPAPYDDAWALMGGPDTMFLIGTQTWYQVFWSPPRGGDPYYILAHQFMAAKLNILNGADYPSEVGTALTLAETWLSTHEPGKKLKKFARLEPIGLASTLGMYNEGLIGPGHCSE
jgi:hypothetical protein